MAQLIHKLSAIVVEKEGLEVLGYHMFVAPAKSISFEFTVTFPVFLI